MPKIINTGFKPSKNICNALTDEKIKNSKDYIPVINNPLAIISGLWTKFVNFWFLKKKLRRLVYTFSSISLFVLIILFYMIFFNLIEPSVSKYQDVTPDISAWNADADLKTIEFDYIYVKRSTIYQPEDLDPDGFIYRNRFSDSRKYLVEPDLTRLYIPTDMSQGIILLYNDYQTTDQSSTLEQIEHFAGWLKQNAVIIDSIAVWTHPYGFTKYGLKSGWTGAWAMGSVLSALARYYQISKDPDIIELGKMAVTTFHTRIEDGGVLALDEYGNYWFEEYPAHPRNSVLNGHINGIFGLYDFWRVSGFPLALNLAQKGITTVEKNIERYDTGYWSYYDLYYPFVTDYYYHKMVHIPQLQVLYQISNKPIFKTYSEKWRSYFNEPYYSIFKLSILYDALHRRLTYKSLFTWGKSSG